MLIKKDKKLAREIIGYISIAGVISVFFYWFLLYMSQAVVEVYCAHNDIFMDQFQMEMTDFWQRRVSLITAVVVFLFLCFFLTGQKLMYIKQLILGVEALRENNMDYEVPLEGEDELSMLAESINYLAKSQRELKEKEEALRLEKDAFIRELSHDIRTPLTSVLAMSEYVEQKNDMTSEEMKEYIFLVKSKSAQMKILTDRLLNEGQRKPVFIENGKLLFEQLVYEWQELLEDEFVCKVDMDECSSFSAKFDIAELRRIFDNLASNILKYADSSKEVLMHIDARDGYIVIRQSNFIQKDELDPGQEQMRKKRDSYGIGLQSIERLAKIYEGTMEVQMNELQFVILIKLRLE